MKKVFLALVLTGLIGTLSEFMAPARAADRVCATWGADHHVPGYRAPDGTWVPARIIPGPCTRWETTTNKRDARMDAHMDRQNRLERERAARERRTR